MDQFPLVIFLPLATFGLAIFAALASKKRVDDIKNGLVYEKSSLAIDGPGPSPFGQNQHRVSDRAQ